MKSMETKRIELFINECIEHEDSRKTSTVGVKYFDAINNCQYGDYETFECEKLTTEQITDATKRLLEKLLPHIPAEEKKFDPNTKRGVVFNRNPDGSFTIKA